MPKIAIVEDDQAIREMYRIKFETEGYEVVVAENGKRGLELVEATKPDLVLLDLMMPEMTGEEMLTRVRATDWGKDMKVIVLTNVSQDEIMVAIDKLRVSDFIVKAHFTPQQVADRVKAVLAGKR